ncbi:MAG TPA: UbiA family prenyltransferase [Desulfuromonadales bacterium]|nr:UbiA family prenyltransferase [Desulfuromonadales bacterium]
MRLAEGTGKSASQASQLLRPGLCAMVALSSLTGLMLAQNELVRGTWLLLICGVFLLASGASVINQIQERHTDALMRRTRLRPLACGRMNTSTGLTLALGLTAGGAVLLGLIGTVPLLLGGSALVLYNALYTPLKRHTSLALLAGALAGAIPPLIGWTAAGQSPLDIRILFLALLLFLWQIPHFCALAFRHREDYRRAGLYMPPSHRGIVLVWLLALGTGTAQAGAFGLLRTPAAAPLLLLLFLWLLPPVIRTIDHSAPGRRLDMRLQLFLAVLLVSIVFDGLVLP